MNKISPPCVWNNKEQHFDAIFSTPWYKLISELSSQFLSATHHFYENEGIKPISLPITTGSISSPMGKGSDSLPVKINLFSKETYLADSMQFQLECLVRVFDKGVYYVMPTFRGEEADQRHLNQFFHSEVEFIGDLKDAIKLAEQYFIYITSQIVKKNGELIEKYGLKTEHLRKVISMKNFPQITYNDALKLLGNDSVYLSTIDNNIKVINSKGEQKIIEELGGICWLTYYPSEIAPFYQARCNNGELSLTADLLCGIGEVLGLGERQKTKEKLNQNLNICEVSNEEYIWYLNMKYKYPLQTSGFGLGMERYLLWILEHSDIRDIPVFQRLKGLENIP